MIVNRQLEYLGRRHRKPLASSQTQSTQTLKIDTVTKEAKATTIERFLQLME